MNKPYFCQNFFLTDWRPKRLKNKIDLLLFYGETSVDFRIGKWVVAFHKTSPSRGAGQSTWLGLSGCLALINFAFQAHEICKMKPLGTHSF